MEQTTTLPGIGETTETTEELAPQYNVVLIDDDEHTYEYVIEMLQKLFFYSKADAFRRAVEVDTMGRTVVLTCELAAAEFARDQIHAFGADPRMPKSKGSMKAIIEPVTAGV
ncbi:MAG: ATP-dependent Clp protease adaptor ClpS [Acidobacteria bacterium]|nr:ATP-dependent Clp protease adaptor ClpS [Acidobacteriota bacterium]